MTNNIVSIGGNLPAFVKQRESNLTKAMGGGLASSVPSISLRTSRFRFNKEGIESQPLEASHLDLIVIDASLYIQRAYFDKPFDPKTDAKPACTSHKGISPDEGSTAPQCATCQFCPMNVKQPDPRRPGQNWTPCGFSKDIAVMIPGDPSGTVWRLKLSSMTVFNTDVRDNGTMGWKAIVNHIDAMGADAAYHVIRASFDPEAAVPALLFKIQGVVGDGQTAYDEAFYNIVNEAIESGQGAKIVNDAEVTAQPVGTVENQSAAPAPVPVQVVPVQVVPVQPAPVNVVPVQTAPPVQPIPVAPVQPVVAPVAVPVAPAAVQVVPAAPAIQATEQAMDADAEEIGDLLSKFK